jgi:hypothetical protein
MRVITHITRFSHSHTPVQGPPLQGTPHDEISILDLIKLLVSVFSHRFESANLMPHRVDSLRVEGPGSKAEIGQFDMSSVIYQKVLSVSDVLGKVRRQRTSGFRSRWIYPSL